VAAVRAAAEALPRCRGSRTAREVARLADGLAESPPETRLRLLLHRAASLQGPAASERVVGGREVLLFAYPELKIVIEYDGLWHAEPGQFEKDRKRLNRLSAEGWLVIFVTAADLRHPERLLARLVAELAR
jgi:very-short-patch-repair endonuclease